MLRDLTRVAAIGILLWVGASSVHGQKATEMFIPIGQSPGLSNRISIIGTIEAIDVGAQTIVVAGGSEIWNVVITDRTNIWLDRSTLRLPSRKGSFADLRPDLMAEVKYEQSAAGKGAAEWIKIRIVGPSG